MCEMFCNNNYRYVTNVIHYCDLAGNRDVKDIIIHDVPQCALWNTCGDNVFSGSYENLLPVK